MNPEKINKITNVKAGYWPRNPTVTLLIIIAFIGGCCYLINSIMELLQAA